MSTVGQPAPTGLAASVAGIVGILTQANVAIPVVIGTITSIVGIVKALRGDVRDLTPIIADLERQLAENDARGRAEVERLKALLH
jgi:hypothetical protein